MSQVQVDINTLAVGVDAYADVDGQSRPWARMLRGFKLGGSAAIADAEIELFVESTSLGLFRNTSTDDIPDNQHIQPMNVPVPANAKVRCVVRIASGSAAFATALMSP